MSASSKVQKLGQLARVLVEPEGRRHLWTSIKAFEGRPAGECPCCGFTGKFRTAGAKASVGKMCPHCRSMARHRLLALAVRDDFVKFDGRKILHFAPEPIISRMVAANSPAEYLTADISPGRADRVLDLEAIDLPTCSVDLVIASHVLEHVDDRRALSELHRVLRPGGDLIAMIPIIEGWSTTFEDSSIASTEERKLYYGQVDHVRFYGSDFRERLTDSGFGIAEYTAGPIESVRYRLSRGTKIFRCTKPVVS